MSGHLLLFAIGPVQDFIAQARRTRDLWFGSYLLSELSRSAARALVGEGALLIFPALARGDAELEPCRSALRDSGRAPLAIANKLLAELPPEVDPLAAARATRQAVQRFWFDAARKVRARCEGLLVPGIDAIWEEQISSLLELSATWVPWTDGGYARAREELEAAAAARKVLRDFSPWRCLRGGVPKSSLDGGRETVLLEPPKLGRNAGHGQAVAARSSKLALKYRIADSEQLDAVGLVKRAGGEPKQFVPIANVALASWIGLVSREHAAPFEALRRACRELDLPEVDRPDLPCAASFRFDASVFLASRWESLFKEQSIEVAPARWGSRHVGPLLQRAGDPYPYVACLVADGDGMGKAIAALTSASENRRFSKRLGEFAAAAREIVEGRHHGSLVYAGGDDVLAFLPVPTALAAADALRRHFVEVMSDALPALTGVPTPTLSAGIGIGHLMEGMGDLLALGRRAEKLAKGGHLPTGRDRNALGILVDKRSGRTRQWRARWDEWQGQPIVRLRDDVLAFDAGLSIRKIYEVERTLRRLPAPADVQRRWGAEGSVEWARVLRLEIKRSLDRVGDGPASEKARPDLSAEHYRDVHAATEEWVNRLLIARTLAAAEPRLRQRAEPVAS